MAQEAVDVGAEGTAPGVDAGPRVRAIRGRTTAADIADALGGHRSSAGWVVHCPAHDDQTPSLSVTEHDGRVLVRCHAGCKQHAVIAELRERGLWQAAEARDDVQRRAPDRISPYVDVAGTVVRRTVRWNRPGGAKVVRPQTPDGRGGWRTGEMRGPRPLYRLPDLLAHPDVVVLVTEGEPAADAAGGMLPGYAVTTSSGGAQAAQRTDWSPLRGRRVVVWRDADAPGVQYAADVMRCARAAGAADVRVVSLPPGLPGGWDLADALPDGWTVETVRRMVDAAQCAGNTRCVRAVTIAELIKLDLAPREMVVDPILPVQGLLMLYGPRGIGKTYLLLALAYAIAIGGELLRYRAPQPRRVLYLDGEMPASVMRSRMMRLICGAGVEADPNNLLIVTPDLQNGGMPDLATAAGQAAIESLLDGVDVVIVDSISTLSSAAENDADEWLPLQRWVLAQRRAGRSVVLGHHAGKNGQARGTSRREDVLDTVLALRRPRDYRAEQGARAELIVEKGRGIYGDAARTIEIALVDDGCGRLRWAHQNLDGEITERVAELVREGKKHREIAKELGIGIATVSAHRRRAVDANLLTTEVSRAA